MQLEQMFQNKPNCRAIVNLPRKIPLPPRQDLTKMVNEPCAPFKFSLVSLLGCTSNSAKRHCKIVSVVNTSEMQTNRVFRFFKMPKRFVVILPSYAVAMYYYVCARYAIVQQKCFAIVLLRIEFYKSFQTCSASLLLGVSFVVATPFLCGSIALPCKL